jgi:hypothetical protein
MHNLSQVLPGHHYGQDDDDNDYQGDKNAA